MSTIRQIDWDAALLDPAKYFTEPADLLDFPNVDFRMKLKLLEQWERDARAQAVAEEEGMCGGKPPMLGRIREARRQLAGDALEEGVGTKHG